MKDQEFGNLWIMGLSHRVALKLEILIKNNLVTYMLSHVDALSEHMCILQSFLTGPVVDIVGKYWSQSYRY